MFQFWDPGAVSGNGGAGITPSQSWCFPLCVRAGGAPGAASQHRAASGNRSSAYGGGAGSAGRRRRHLRWRVTAAPVR